MACRSAPCVPVALRAGLRRNVVGVAGSPQRRQAGWGRGAAMDCMTDAGTVLRFVMVRSRQPDAMYDDRRCWRRVAGGHDRVELLCQAHELHLTAKRVLPITYGDAAGSTAGLQ